MGFIELGHSISVSVKDLLASHSGRVKLCDYLLIIGKGLQSATIFTRDPDRNTHSAIYSNTVKGNSVSVTLPQGTLSSRSEETFNRARNRRPSLR